VYAKHSCKLLSDEGHKIISWSIKIAKDVKIIKSKFHETVSAVAETTNKHFRLF